MTLGNTKAAFPRGWLPWTFAALLTLLCGTLAVLQNRWINEISRAERDRLHSVLQSGLSRLSADFDAQVAASYAELKPSFADITEWGTRAACERRYVHWRTDAEPLFSRIGLVNLEEAQPQLWLLDMNTGAFAPAPWPAGWSHMRQRFEARSANADLSTLPAAETTLLDFPLYGSMHRTGAVPDNGPPPKEDWLIVEMSMDYVRSRMLPALLEKYVTSAGIPAYDSQIATAAAPQNKADAFIDLLQPDRLEPPDGPPRPREPHPGAGRLRLLLFHRGYSMEDQVSGARLRNLALSGGILLMILTTVGVLLRYARKSQNLAALQMNFVAGVSHELRTPLTVIRTAAFNLRGRVATRPEQVEKYGQLIQNESEKLSILVEQVLRYGGAAAGRVIGERRPISANALIEHSLAGSLAAREDVTVEQDVQPGLPMILVDELAWKHALQNLLDNAVKHGCGESAWIGLSAAENGEHSIEIRVRDRGPGIAEDEQAHLFDAFFRGKRALRDQVHGTGLGLNLAKSIIEAHGGAIRLKSEPGKGAEFIVSIPAAPEEEMDAFSNTADRG